MPLVTREGKGSKLTIQEMDSNLTGLKSGQFVFDDFMLLNPDLSGATGGFVGEEITILKIFTPGIFIDALQNQDYTVFLEPIITTDRSANLFGNLIQLIKDNFYFFAFNGLLFSGQGIFGAGVLNVFSQPGFFVSKTDSIPYYGNYLYTYDDITGDNFHSVTLDSPTFNIIRTTFEITVNDTATSWSDVTVNTYTLVTP